LNGHIPAKIFATTTKNVRNSNSNILFATPLFPRLSNTRGWSVTMATLPSNRKSAAKKRPPATLNNADWKTSKAKKLVAQDIIDDEIPLEGYFDHEEVFHRLYEEHEFFANFPFDGTRYRDCIDRLRNAIKRLKHWADYDSNKVLEDLAKHPPKAQKIRGELKWDDSDAQKLLKQDVDDGVHLQLKGSQLHETREEYKLFGLRVFQKHLDQEKQSRKEFDEVTMSRRYKRLKHGDKRLSRKQQS
jgi:hypothetical protein